MQRRSAAATKADVTTILDRLDLVLTREEALSGAQQVLQQSLTSLQQEVAIMKSEMLTKSEAAQFATKDDLQQSATKDDLQKAVKSLNTGIDQVLTVLVNVDQRLTTKVDTHEVRIKRLEKKTGVATMAA